VISPTLWVLTPRDIHPGQGFSYLGFIAGIALEHLAVKLAFPVSGNREVLNAPRRGEQIAGVRPITIASAPGRAFAPRRAKALRQFFPHDLLEQDLDGAHRQTAQVLAEFLLHG
jgi:hypothetical protein